MQPTSLKISLLCSLLLLAGSLSAQQESLFSRYMFNSLTLSPAYAGSHESLRLAAQLRSQWAGIEGAPSTAVLALDGISPDTRSGWGLLLGGEKIGLYQTQDVQANYAYRFELGRGKLALGLRAGGTFYQHRASDASLAQGGDLAYQANENYLVAKAGVGAYYQDKHCFLGFSVPNLATYRKNSPFSLNDDQSYLRKHYFLHGGFLVEFDRGLMLKPTALVKYVKGAPIQLDLNTQLYFNNRISIGAGYRTGDAFVLMLEFFPNERLRLGYAYDATFSQLQYQGANAHEVVIGYEIRERRRRANPIYKMQDIHYF